MEFKYATKLSVYVSFVFLAFMLFFIISNVLNTYFNILWKLDIMLFLWLAIGVIISVVFGHLDWHEEQDKKKEVNT